MNMFIINKLKPLRPDVPTNPTPVMVDADLQSVLDWLRDNVGNYKMEVNPTGYLYWGEYTPTTTLPIKGDGWEIAHHRVESWNPLTIKLHIADDTKFEAAKLAIPDKLRVYVYDRYGIE